MVDALRPGTLSEALKWLSANKAMPFGGGTDLMVHYRNYTGTSSKISRPVLFTDNIEELRQIEEGVDQLRIGSAVLLSELEEHEKVPQILRESISQIAAPALRNRATLAGNICNASPAGDSLPPLYIYEARLTLSSVRGDRIVKIEDFITGPGKTILAEDELLTFITIPYEGKEESYYRKVGTRAANALSKLSVAAIAQKENGIIIDFGLALGAVAPLIVRNRDCEKLVIGQKAQLLNIETIVDAYAPHIRPIDDQRSTAAYRKEVSLNIIRNFLEQIQE